MLQQGMADAGVAAAPVAISAAFLDAAECATVGGSPSGGRESDGSGSEDEGSGSSSSSVDNGHQNNDSGWGFVEVLFGGPTATASGVRGQLYGLVYVVLNTAMALCMMLQAGFVMYEVVALDGLLVPGIAWTLGASLIAMLSILRALRYVWVAWGMPWLARLGDDQSAGLQEEPDSGTT